MGKLPQCLERRISHLHHRHAELEVHIEPVLSSGLPGAITTLDKGRASRAQVTPDLSTLEAGFTVLDVVVSLSMYSSIHVMADVRNDVLSVAPNGPAFNPSWHLTRLGRHYCNRRVSGCALISASSRRLARQSDSSGNLAATVAADRAFPAAVA